MKPRAPYTVLLGLAVAVLAGCRSREQRLSMLEDTGHRLTAQDSLRAATRQPMSIPLEPASWPVMEGAPAGMAQDLTPVAAPAPGVSAAAPIKAPAEPRRPRSMP